ncbi:MAG: hypothetical protein EA364_04090 [Balneolaceae bacterium]|jgi:prefoldin subunit 5|nr:MAG: hypothetical protein EA364_04090 [Balneolaceae bacterium]
MSEIESIQKEIEKLPNEIEGYKRRIMDLGNFVVIEYSKKQLFIRHVHPGIFPAQEVEDNLLVDVVASTIEDAVKEMSKKIQHYL